MENWNFQWQTVLLKRWPNYPFIWMLVLVFILGWILLRPKHTPMFEYKTQTEVNQMDNNQAYEYLTQLRLEKQKIFDSLNWVQTIAYYNWDVSMFSWIDKKIESARVQKDTKEKALWITYDNIKPVPVEVALIAEETPSTQLNKALNLQ